MADITWHISILKSMMDGICLMMKLSKEWETGQQLNIIVHKEGLSLLFSFMKNKKLLSIF
jgi:hypothetical protein